MPAIQGNCDLPVRIRCVIYITGICVFSTMRMGEMARRRAILNSELQEIACPPG